MSYGKLESESKGKYLRIKEGKPVDIHILTESQDVVHQFVHILDKGKRILCVKKSCEWCQKGSIPRERWSIVVYDWNDKIPKIFEFGFSIFNQIKGIAMMLEEMDQTIHQIDLRITATGEGVATKYQVMQKPMKEQVPDGLLLPKITEEAPF